MWSCCSSINNMLGPFQCHYQEPSKKKAFLWKKSQCAFLQKDKSIGASTKVADDNCPLKKMMQQHSAVVPGAQSSRLELETSNFPALLIFTRFEKFPIQQLWALTSGSHSRSLARPWLWCSPRDIFLSFPKEMWFFWQFLHKVSSGKLNHGNILSQAPLSRMAFGDIHLRSSGSRLCWGASPPLKGPVWPNRRFTTAAYHQLSCEGIVSRINNNYLY